MTFVLVCTTASRTPHDTRGLRLGREAWAGNGEAGLHEMAQLFQKGRTFEQNPMDVTRHGPESNILTHGVSGAIIRTMRFATNNLFP